MRKFAVTAVLLFVFVLSGYNYIYTKNTDGNGVLTGNKPPKVNIEIDRETYETKLGSYCWGPKSIGKGECADTAGPVELLKGKEPIQVQAGEKITLKMDYKPKPNEVHLTQIKSENEMEIEVNDNQFIAPNKKGTYFYAYSVWWMDEEDRNLSHGDAFYAFVLEVK